jgi:hypothetical protein
MNTAPGVSYLHMEGTPKLFFRCTALRSTLSTAACAQNWRRAQHLHERDIAALHHCRDCAIGAAHAGEKFVARSKIFGTDFCPRCRRGGARIIGNRRCVSCANRDYEVAKGKNAKGTAPLLRLDPRRLGVMVDGVRVDLRDTMTIDMVEMVIQTLRTVPGKLVFARGRLGPTITAAALAARYREPPKNAAISMEAANSRKRLASLGATA